MTFTALEIGQIWEEIDRRSPFGRKVTIVGFTPDNKVLIRHVRTTKANPMRFNGKSGGYRFVGKAKWL